MVQGYYALEEAAKILGMPVEQLKGMAQRREIRAFSDGGSWKFRTQDVLEHSRKLGLGSEPEIRLSGMPAPAKDDIMADSDEQVLLDESALSGIRLDSGADSEVTVIGMRGGPHDSGSDVRLVLANEGKQSDSDVRLVPDSGAKIDFGPVPRPDEASDDEVRIVPSVQAPTDSDIRLTFEDSAVSKSGSKRDMGRTEEINLEDSSKLKAPSSSKRMKRPTPPPGDSDSDFKFDDVDAGFKLEGDSSSDFEITGFESSDDVVDLGKPKRKSGSSGNLADSDSSKTKGLEAIRLADDSDIGLGKPGDSDITSGGPDSGINLASPDDSGISLEADSGSGSDSEFELSLDSESSGEVFETDEIPAFRDDDDSTGDLKTAAVPAGGKKGKGKGKKDEETEVSSDSDFELALDDEYEVDEESGSEVVAIDDDSASVVEESGLVASAADIGDLDEFDDELVPTGGAVAMAPRSAVGIGRAAAAAPWEGWMLIPLGFTTFFLVIVGMMMFEVMRNAWSYNTPYTINGTIIDWVAGFAGK